MRYHLTWVRKAIIKKYTNNKCWRECGENGTLLQCWWEHKLVQPLWRTMWRFLKKLKNRATVWPCNPTPGHIFWGKYDLKGYMCLSVHCSSLYNSQDIEATQMSVHHIDREMYKDGVHIYNGILLSHLKEWNDGIFSNVNGPRDCHIEWSKSEGEEYCMTSFISGI